MIISTGKSTHETNERRPTTRRRSLRSGLLGTKECELRISGRAFSISSKEKTPSPGSSFCRRHAPHPVRSPDSQSLPQDTKHHRNWHTQRKQNEQTWRLGVIGTVNLPFRTSRALMITYRSQNRVSETTGLGIEARGLMDGK